MATKVLDKMQGLKELFDHFINNSWEFETAQIDRLLEVMSPEEKLEFDFDIRNIDWNSAYYDFIYGMRKFYLKEDTPTVESGY